MRGCLRGVPRNHQVHLLPRGQRGVLHLGGVADAHHLQQAEDGPPTWQPHQEGSRVRKILP